MKRLIIAAVGLALVLDAAAVACADDTREKVAAFDRGYLAGREAGLRDGQEAAYQQSYNEGAEDGESDVYWVSNGIISGGIHPYYVAWCDVAVHCRKASIAAFASSPDGQIPLSSIPTVDVDRFEDTDAAYAAGFDDGHQAGEVVGKSRGQAKGYDDGYKATTCASPLAKIFLMSCPRR